MNLWQPFTFQPDLIYTVHLGQVVIWMKRSGEDWYLARDWVQTEEASSEWRSASIAEARAAEEKEWTQWVATNPSLSVRLSPRMPDRPLILRPDLSLRLAAGGKALFFVNIPIWIAVAVGEEETPLAEIPAVVLSNSWFGDPSNGELCYSLKTATIRKEGDLETAWHEAACPVFINNQSSSELDFSRLCLHVEYLSLYRKTGRLWANQVNVTYRGEEQLSQVVIGRKAPEFETGLQRIAEARRRPDRSLVKKSFQFLKTLTEY